LEVAVLQAQQSDQVPTSRDMTHYEDDTREAADGRLQCFDVFGAFLEDLRRELLTGSWIGDQRTFSDVEHLGSQAERRGQRLSRVARAAQLCRDDGGYTGSAQGRGKVLCTLGTGCRQRRIIRRL